MNHHSPPILCLVGGTATGKTKLATHLAKVFAGTLISADSRQVYRGMDLVTGKDHAEDVSIAGIDLVSPAENCSVAVWYRVIKPLLTSSRLPIVVGGTGLWFKAVTGGIATLNIPPDPALRLELESLSPASLRARLHSLAPSRLASMNQSDQGNPRRLIRAIEIASSPALVKSKLPRERNTKMIGLNYPASFNYEEVIRQRVLARLRLGAVEETKTLLRIFSPKCISLTAIGYRSLIRYLNSELDYEEMITHWTRDELKYAKRQRTWFQKIPAIQWYEVTEPNLTEHVVSDVQKWYDSIRYEYQ